MTHQKFGTHPIRCGNRRCAWRGFETDLQAKPRELPPGSIGVSDNVCPKCGDSGYFFMSDREIKAWERTKAQEAAGA